MKPKHLKKETDQKLSDDINFEKNINREIKCQEKSNQY